MPGIPFPKLLDRFVLALEQAGVTVLDLSTGAAKPARLLVTSSEVHTECLVFLWTVTPGGGPPGVRPASERRIQVTNAQTFPLVPGVRTIVGGWSAEFGAYAFWDPTRHSKFSLRSPSLQVSAIALEQAGHAGVGAYVRKAAEGWEVVVTVAPSALLWYLQEGHALHSVDEDATAVPEITKGTPEEERQFIDASETEAQASRRHVLVECMRAFRDATFRPAVMRAYAYRCAVCGCALRLVDAAHIVPVFHPKSTDDVTNGLALCRQHHGAYDNGLLGVRSDFRIILNRTMIQRLKRTLLDAGLEVFQSQLPSSITLPAEPEVRPEPLYLRLGLEARQWPQNLIA